VDPVTFANVIASTAEGLDGGATDIATIVDALPDALAAITANQQDLGRIFRAVPGITGTLQQRADALVAVAESFGTLALTIHESEDDLVRFVSDTAELSSRAAELLDAEGGRLDRILSDSLSVLDLVGEQPGAVEALLAGAPRFVNGLAAATRTGAFRAPIANFGVLNPGSLLDAKGDLGEAQGGAGVGPDIVIEGFPLEDGVTVGPSEGDTATMGAANGAVRLLDNLLGPSR
jgi:ABC-type transporter Mla subunit MlaD